MSRSERKRRDMLNDEINNPCFQEQELSFKCLSENNFDKDVCAVHFANYQACKDFWGRIRSDRRAKGIVPYLPNYEERKKIKEEYMKTRKV